MNFAILFTITFVHDYFEREEDSLLGLSIVPDEATKQILRDNRLLYRIENNELICFTQTRVDITPEQTPSFTVVKDKPLLPWNPDHVLRFRLFVSDKNFMNYTSLKIFDVSDLRYHFTNDNDNTQVGVNFLSKPVPAYHAADSYEMGSLVESGGNLFEAIAYSDSASPKPTNDTAFWAPINDQSVSQADLEEEDEDKCFGVIEISFDKVAAANFRVLNNDKIRDGGARYIIHFRNRSSYWKYIFTTPTKAKEKTGTVTFKPVGKAMTTESVTPIALTIKGVKTILKNDTTTPLPSADASVLRADPEPPTTKSKIVSEIRVTD